MTISQTVQVNDNLEMTVARDAESAKVINPTGFLDIELTSRTVRTGRRIKLTTKNQDGSVKANIFVAEAAVEALIEGLTIMRDAGVDTNNRS